MDELKHLYIRNLAFSVTADDLLHVVTRIAPGSTAEIVTDRFSGRSKGFGFITTPTSAAAKILLDRLKGRTLAGRTLLVAEARTKEPRPQAAPLEVAVAEPIAELDPPREVIDLVKVVEMDLVAYFSAHPEQMKRMPHRMFEKLNAQMWDRLGYEIELRKQTRDGGIDIIAMRQTEVNLRFLIQCKRPEPHKKVSVEAVRSLYGAKLDFGGSKAILATTVTFTRDARELLIRHPWELEGQDYEDLVNLLDRIKRSRNN